MALQPDRLEHRARRLDEEVEVLEGAEEPQVDPQADPEQRVPRLPPVRLDERVADEPVDRRARPDEEQEALGQWLLEELTSERRWENLFASSPEKLAQLAKEARAEDRAGQTQDLDPDQL